MKKIGIIGARGYVGRELVEIVGRHTGLELALSVSQRDGASPEDIAAEQLDAYLLALPNGATAAYVDAITRARPDAILVDLSADHRFDDAWVYGQPERLRYRVDALRGLAHQDLGRGVGHHGLKIAVLRHEFPPVAMVCDAYERHPTRGC